MLAQERQPRWTTAFLGDQERGGGRERGEAYCRGELVRLAGLTLLAITVWNSLFLVFCHGKKP